MTDSTEPSGLDGHRRPSTYLSFTPYPLQAGDRITIESGPRHGDGEVIAVSERKVRLRCPFSGKFGQHLPGRFAGWAELENADGGVELLWDG